MLEELGHYYRFASVTALLLLLLKAWIAAIRGAQPRGNIANALAALKQRRNLLRFHARQHPQLTAILAPIAGLTVVVWIVGIVTALDAGASVLDRFVTGAAAAFVGAYFAYRLNLRAQRQNELRKFRIEALERIQSMFDDPEHFGRDDILDFARRWQSTNEVRRQAERVRDRWLFYLVHSIQLEANQHLRHLEMGERLEARAMEPAIGKLVSEMKATVEALMREAVLDQPPPFEPPIPKEAEFLFNHWR